MTRFLVCLLGVVMAGCLSPTVRVTTFGSNNQISICVDTRDIEMERDREVDVERP